MRSLHYIEPHVLEWREVPEPSLQSALDAIVKPIVSTICDIDPLIIAGKLPLPAPFAIGHEAIAEVVEAGSDCKLEVGQRVALTYYDACGHCGRCQAQKLNRCAEYSPDVYRRAWHGIGFTPVGFFSDLVRVPNADSSVFPLPAAIDPTHLGSLGDNIGFAYEFTVPHLLRNAGADVLIMGGCGSIALYAVAFAKAAGASRVVFADTDREALAIAEAYGAEIYDGEVGKTIGEFPITVDASANAASLQTAILSTQVEGCCSSVGGHFEPVPLPLFAMYAKGIHFYTGPGRGLPNIAGAFRFIDEGFVDPAPVTSEVLPMADAARALRHPSRKPVFLAD